MHSSQKPMNIFYKIDHILGRKAGPNKFKRIKMIPYILSDHNRIKLELNNKRSYTKTWRQTGELLNDSVSH